MISGTVDIRYKEGKSQLREYSIASKVKGKGQGQEQEQEQEQQQNAKREEK